MEYPLVDHPGDFYRLICEEYDAGHLWNAGQLFSMCIVFRVKSGMLFTIANRPDLLSRPEITALVREVLDWMMEEEREKMDELWSKARFTVTELRPRTCRHTDFCDDFSPDDEARLDW